jgi:hypothetical protein
VTSSCQPSDVDLLSATFGGSGWSFECVWVTTASGPDWRKLVASKGGLTLTAQTAEDLGAKVIAADITAAIEGDES